MKDNLTIGFVAFAVITLVVIGPIAIIWALNTLFPNLNIAYSLANWFAVFILVSAIQTTVRTGGK